jgi:hypothetical protein
LGVFYILILGGAKKYSDGKSRGDGLKKVLMNFFGVILAG